VKSVYEFGGMPDKPFAEAQLDYYKRKAGRPVGSKRVKRLKAGA
jgi:hypothetical protein